MILVLWRRVTDSIKPTLVHSSQARLGGAVASLAGNASISKTVKRPPPLLLSTSATGSTSAAPSPLRTNSQLPGTPGESSSINGLRSSRNSGGQGGDTTPGTPTVQLPGTPSSPAVPVAALAPANSTTTLATSSETGIATPIRLIRFGEFDIDTWFQAPYPEEYSLVPDGRLWICEFCLKYMKSRFMASRHRVSRQNIF